MEEVISYKTNRFLASVISVLAVALVFSIGLDKLLVFYADPWYVLVVGLFFIVLPLVVFFGFNIQLRLGLITYRHNLFFRKIFKISDLSHVLYQPTWRGISSHAKTARSLHIVREFGGWKDTISLANGVFREEDLADLAKRLKHLNPQINFDESADQLIKKYYSG